MEEIMCMILFLLFMTWSARFHCEHNIISFNPKILTSSFKLHFTCDVIVLISSATAYKNHAIYGSKSVFNYTLSDLMQGIAIQSP